MMAKRFTDTMKWNEDWYLDLSLTHKMFWIYICDNCDHAGIFKPNKRIFELLIGEKINSDKFLESVNKDKLRVVVLGNGRWYLTGFIEFQYGDNLSTKNRVHKSILDILNKNDINWDGGYTIKEAPTLDSPKEKVEAKPKSLEVVTEYFLFKKSDKKEAEKFYNFYGSKGWKVGKSPMKNWKMAANNWIARNRQDKPDSSYLGGQLNAMKG
jgi:hypothetical protein